MSNSLWPHELQHTRLLCPPLSPRFWSNSCPLSWWCYLTISSSAALFSFCLQSFPASGSFPIMWLFTSVSSVAQSCLTLWDPMDYSMPGFPDLHHHLWSLLKFMPIESVTLPNHLILCHPLLLLPSIFPSSRIFSSESSLCIRWPKY